MTPRRSNSAPLATPAESSEGDSGRRFTAGELRAFTHRHWPQIAVQEGELAVGFLRMNALVREAGQRAMSPLDLSPPEFDVLVALRRSAPPHVQTPSDLYRSLLVSAGGITYVLGLLEKKGLVSRETLESDRRVKPVRLTRKGRGRVEKAMAAVQRETRTLLRAGMSQRELATLRDQLYALLEGAEEHARQLIETAES
jgi:DNA-binding MarR family transcriptional regulator